MIVEESTQSVNHKNTAFLRYIKNNELPHTPIMFNLSRGQADVSDMLCLGFRYVVPCVLLPHPFRV